MRCNKAQQLLALHAGGDLPEQKTAALLSHIESCEACRARLAHLRNSRSVIERIAGADIPEPLPVDFASRLLLEVQREKSAKRSRIAVTAKLGSWKPALVLGAAALAVLLTWGPVRKMIEAETRFSFLRDRPVRPVQALNPGEIAWSAGIRLVGKIEGPWRLSEVDPPDAPGIYAVLHRPDPGNRPGVFAVDYIGQSRRLSSPVGYLWLYKQKDILLSRVGSEDSLFVVFYPMPESSEQERLELRNSLVARFEPYLTDQGGV